MPQSWRGISGAPVFVDNQLAGIIIQVPDDFKGGRLRGIRAPTLLANASFREAIEPRWLRWTQDQSWVLVIKSEQPAVDLPPKVAGAIRKFNDQYLVLTGGRAFSPQPVVVAIEDALASPGRWLQLIRALCAAPVMIADVTQFQPAVMLALVCEP
jgi:hypothetical protein